MAVDLIILFRVGVVDERVSSVWLLLWGLKEVEWICQKLIFQSAEFNRYQLSSQLCSTHESYR